MKWKERFLSVLYPRRCQVCHDIVTPKGGLICPACLKKVSFVQEPVCLRCGKEIASGEIEYCYDCSRHTHFFTRGYALAIYEDVMRDSIRKFKNGGRMEYADWYAQAIWERYGSQLQAIGADAVVPVPLHRGRRYQRGYNQAELLAKRLAKKLGVPMWSDALLRTQKTTAQKYLGAGERKRNLESAFAVGKRPLEGKTILLADDIYTTGGTADACAKALLQAGVREIYLVNVCIGENDE